GIVPSLAKSIDRVNVSLYPTDAWSRSSILSATFWISWDARVAVAWKLPAGGGGGGGGGVVGTSSLTNRASAASQGHAPESPVRSSKPACMAPVMAVRTTDQGRIVPSLAE